MGIVVEPTQHDLDMWTRGMITTGDSDKCDGGDAQFPFYWPGGWSPSRSVVIEWGMTGERRYYKCGDGGQYDIARDGPFRVTAAHLSAYARVLALWRAAVSYQIECYIGETDLINFTADEMFGVIMAGEREMTQFEWL